MSPLIEEGQDEIQRFSDLAVDFPLSSEVDSIAWRWNNGRKFSVHSGYNFLIFGGVIDRRISQLWKLKIPLRIKIFMWLASKNRVLTTDTLSKRGWQEPSICALCHRNGENLEHLLFECTYAKSLWRILLHGMPTTIHLLLNLPGDLPIRWSRARNSQSGQAKIRLDHFFAAACWELWKERNSRIFENRVAGSDEVGNKVLSSVNFWNSTLRD